MIPDDIIDFGLSPFTEGDLGEIRAGLADGSIRRFGAVANHRRLGYAANSLTVWNIGGENLDAVGAAFAARAFVSHCYARATAPAWPYDLYAMVHARTSEELAERVSELSALAERIVGAKVACQSLETVMEYKKVPSSGALLQKVESK